MEFCTFNAKEDKGMADLVYPLFKKIWPQALKDMGVQEMLHADPFYNADTVGVILKEEIPLGLSLLNSHDLSNSYEKDQKVFSAFKPEIFENLKKRNISKVMTASFSCIEPSHRRSKGSSLPYILAGCDFEYFKVSTSAELCVNTCDVIQKVHKLLYAFNSTYLDRSIKHEREVEIVQVTKEDVHYPEFCKQQILSTYYGGKNKEKAVTSNWVT